MMGSWYAKTTRGLYQWGNWTDPEGPDDSSMIQKPQWVAIPKGETATEVCPFGSNTFIKTVESPKGCWLGYGFNTTGCLGVGHGREVHTPTPIPGSEAVYRWSSDVDLTFAWADTKSHTTLLSCGTNLVGQTGIDDETTERVFQLARVALPEGISISSIATDSEAVFFFTGDGKVFGCGYHPLANFDEDEIFTPEPFDFSARRGLTNGEISVFVTDDGMILTGAEAPYNEETTACVPLNGPWGRGPAPDGTAVHLTPDFLFLTTRTSVYVRGFEHDIEDSDMAEHANPPDPHGWRLLPAIPGASIIVVDGMDAPVFLTPSGWVQADGMPVDEIEGGEPVLKMMC